MKRVLIPAAKVQVARGRYRWRSKDAMERWRALRRDREHWYGSAPKPDNPTTRCARMRHLLDMATGQSTEGAERYLREVADCARYWGELSTYRDMIAAEHPRLLSSFDEASRYDFYGDPLQPGDSTRNWHRTSTVRVESYLESERRAWRPAPKVKPVDPELREALARLTEKQRIVYVGRFLTEPPRKQADLAAQFGGVSIPAISRLEKKAVERMTALLKPR
jgi:hypothetical protein